ncbi:helix-turn-helix domain-containing protein [Microbacterium sp. SORGH_AS_0888]|uniref:helix-turn-helix domain-containing protein n=1 Tax=Microbacterium sp. SORGH_AS_0888 TaxID=3041791 RepID=UPI00278590BB|nr:helix-turn-helix domain-containing protein [Microbacterium sp. SORGH_AS_0888]MDQ1128846.1 DNA-binding IclR family transcriptional regulator [Microbacterium sp. SORGH_AS_0888]
MLEAVASLGAGATAKEVSATLGLPRATTYRLLNLLVQDEYLVRTPDLSGFALGAKVVQLATAAVPERMPRAARSIVDETRSALRGAVHVVRYLDGRMTVLDADPDFPLTDEVRLVREPARSALGRLLLVELGIAGAFAAAAEEDLRRYGAVRRLDGDGPGCVAVPVRDASGALAAAVAFAGPRHRAEEPDAVLAVLGPAVERLGPLLT